MKQTQTRRRRDAGLTQCRRKADAERRRTDASQKRPEAWTQEGSDVESDDYSESARSYELGKASDFGCERPDFSAFLCLWRKLTIGWEMRPVRLVLQNIRNFFSQNGWCLP